MFVCSRSGMGGGPLKSIRDGPASSVESPWPATELYAGGGSSGTSTSLEFWRSGRVGGLDAVLVWRDGGGPAGGANVDMALWSTVERCLRDAASMWFVLWSKV
jgi:hypothetical protein